MQYRYERYSHRLQVEFRTLSKICKKLYYKYAPSRLTHCRNASLVKVPDYEIIALLVWQAEEGNLDCLKYLRSVVKSARVKKTQKIGVLYFLIQPWLNLIAGTVPCQGNT